jgi:hypothetical protein
MYSAQWWAHLQFTRINTAPTILRKKIEDFRQLGAVRLSVEPAVPKPGVRGQIWRSSGSVGKRYAGGFKRSAQRFPLVYLRVSDSPVFFGDVY